MVLDPSTALSVATSVIQFVDFGAKLISKGREIYKSADGVLADHAEQAAVASKLARLMRGLSISADASTSIAKPAPEDRALSEVAWDCLQVADDFSAAIHQLAVTGNRRKWKSFRQALKSVWKKEELEQQTARLDRLRQLVIVHLLVVVHKNQDRASARLVTHANGTERRIMSAVGPHLNQLRQRVDELSDNISELVTRQSQTPEIDELRHSQQLVDHWRDVNQTSLLRIVSSVQERDEARKWRSYHRKVFDSLWFEKMDDRHHMIEEKAHATLQWVFNPPTAIQPQWTAVSAWLECRDGLYWVSGKAGSGKSTLMKWLLHHDRTNELLKSWAGSKRLLKARYFFWGSGTDMQKSLVGLLRSLLYDLLRQLTDPIFIISASRWRSYDLELAHFPAWSSRDLVKAIRSFLQHSADDAKVCLFIDGLDELSGDDEERLEVLGLLKELSHHSNVKVCVSSRPWEIFKEAFADCPQLRLEDLTRNDIRDYITERFEADERFQRLTQKYGQTYSQLILEVTDKAKGVWLWVILVTRSLLRGLRNDDTAMNLLDRLRQIPEKLENYFLQMFSNIEDDYRIKALILVKLALNSSRTLSLMTCSFLDDQTLFGEQDPQFPHNVPLKAMSGDELVERLSRSERRVNAMCPDLLEIVYRAGDKQAFYQHEVEFFHRTARDFLLNPNTQCLVNMDLVASFKVNEFMCKALLAQMKMIDIPNNLLLADFMHYAALLEEESSPILPALLDDLNQLLETQRYAVWSNDLGSKCPVQGWSPRYQGPVPLLCLAIQYGLGRFAKSHILSMPKLVSKHPGRPLLDYALRRRVYSMNGGQAEQLDSRVGGSYDQPDVELIRLILEGGGNPNEWLENSTVWKLFLGFLDTFSSDLGCLDQQSMQPWIESTELLIHYGAVRVVESEIIVPNQSMGRTRVILGKRQILARKSIAAAFGEAEATRLDSLSWWLNATGQNIYTRITRTASSLF
ncbi:hypothetical protein BDW42DRAFT_198819 [Aspergillus taichungensis]|uniref:NACHT domain-containing protein n=1 Tax=Aspergillus taichungensis TaxID=482145 RepID=A0A2J5HI74_9EURO|nr:hypothetical protein BDW42DRAFT_198819 [Aspergillus taichungensis]